MKDKYTLFLLFTGFLYFVLYEFLFENMQFWTTDVVHCYKIMPFVEYLKDHLHIYFFMFLFFVMSFYILKTVYIAVKEIFRIYTLKKHINLLKLKKIKNLIIINTEEKLAFNFFNKIIISNSILKSLNKKERKSIFLHEKGHLLNKDGYKMLLSNLILSLFPKFIKNMLYKSYILTLEINADRYASMFIDKFQIAKSLLNMKTAQAHYPMMNNFTEERLKTLLEENDIKIPKTVHLIIIFILTLIFFTIFYKTCLCGIM
jgi:Zn-dependent protease with chaperone function